MFKCELCGKTTKAGEKQTKKVIETRNKIYSNILPNGKEKISDGYEIVKEINVCEECARLEEEKDEQSRICKKSKRISEKLCNRTFR